MSLFQPFVAEPEDRPPPVEAVIRPVGVRDVDAVAELFLARNGGERSRAVEGVLRDLADGGNQRLLFVAEVAGEVVAYARAARMRYDADVADGPPPGWYLTGVVVDPHHRRRGLGAALTRARLVALERRAERVLYVASSANRASIALHAALGFREVRRPLRVPGLTFTGGEGVLFERRLQG